MKLQTPVKREISFTATTNGLKKMALSAVSLDDKPATPSVKVAAKPARTKNTWMDEFNLKSYLILKRALDIAAAGTLLIILAPLLIVIAILIRMDSPGGAIFAQERVGTRVSSKNGKKTWELQPFTVYKFRSMRQNSKNDVHREFVQAFIKNDSAKMSAIQNGKAGDGVFKIVDDPRVTKIGKFLRKTSLDELPQLWNVVRGDMSLVGPRPPLAYEVDVYTPRHLRRLEAQPGMTGVWQISARSTVDFEKMVDLDVWYSENQSIWEDLRILFMTPIAVARGKGAA
jgi:lipopolysaccharide/colanic/teichoic acid biosynthesis glycosyltransferase